MKRIKEIFTIKNLLIIGVIIYALVIGFNYLKVSNELLKETIRNNTFQRRLEYDSAIIDREMRCKELGKKLGLEYDLYYDLLFKDCRIEIKTGDLSRDIDLGLQRHKYIGVPTKEYLEDYQRLFWEPIESK